MKKALILHGTSATPAHNWFLWLQCELEKAGYSVWLPQLPNSEKPTAKTYNKFLLSNPDFMYDDETILIGHSSGAVEILSLLDNFSKEQHIKAAFLVSAFKDWLSWESLEDLFIDDFDFNHIKQKSDKFVFIHSDNDPYCPLSHAKFLSEQVEGELIVDKGQQHFNTEFSNDYNQFPLLLNIIQDRV